MNIGRNKNYKIVKTNDEAFSQREDEKDDDVDETDNFFKSKLRKFRKNKRIIKAYENMKIINETHKSSLGLECPRYVRNFERYDNREFYKGNEMNLDVTVQAKRNTLVEKAVARKSHNETKNASLVSSFINKKIILPKIF